MLILGVDTETTGLIPEKDRVIELGWCLWDTVAKKPLVMQNYLIYHPGLEITSEITAINGIDVSMLQLYGENAERTFKNFYSYAKEPIISACVAHNAPFDKAMLDAEFARWGLEPLDTPWIDTSTDVPYPKNIQTRKLTHLCAEHGFLNPFPHRALTDVLSMLQMTAGYDWVEIMEVSKSPLVAVEAICAKPWEDRKPEGKKDTEIAKGMGFRFEPKTKKWMKNLRSCHMESFMEQVADSGVQVKYMPSLDTF